MLVERFEKDLMGTLFQLLVANDIVQLITVVQLALHDMLNMAAMGYTISDMTLSNLCFHRGTIKVADWGCGQRDAPVSVLRANFKKLVTCVSQLIGTKCDMGPLKAVYSLNQGHELITPELRGAIDSLRPSATAAGQALAGESWVPSSSSGVDRPNVQTWSWSAQPMAEAAAANVTAASPQLCTATSARNGAMDADPWQSSDGDDAREQPPAAAKCPLGLAVGGGCVPQTSVPVLSPPGLGISAANATVTAAECPPEPAVGIGLPLVTIGTTPKYAPAAAPKPPPVEPPWAHQNNAEAAPWCCWVPHSRCCHTDRPAHAHADSQTHCKL